MPFISNSIKVGPEVSHVDLNNGTVEGLNHEELPIVSIQYHAEGFSVPMNNTYLFHRFLDMITMCKGGNQV